MEENINWAKASHPYPLSLSLIFFISWWFLLASIVVMSGSRLLGRAVIVGTLSIVIALVILSLEKHNYGHAGLLFWIGYGVLLIAAIISLVIILISWRKMRSKQPSTN